MYDFIDRDVTSLDQRSRFLLSAMRAWVGALHDRRCPCIAVGPSFSRAGITAALTPFHMAMTILNRDALTTLRFGFARCGRVHEHEALILSLFTTLRAGHPNRARATMAYFIKKEAIPNLLCSFDVVDRMVVRAAPFSELPDHH